MSAKGGNIPFAGALDANTTAHLRPAVAENIVQKAGTTAHLIHTTVGGAAAATTAHLMPEPADATLTEQAAPTIDGAAAAPPAQAAPTAKSK